MKDTYRRIKFLPSDDFQRTLKDRVNAYFTKKGISPHDNFAMYRKTAIIMLWMLASYLLLVFGSPLLGIPVWGVFLAAISLGLATAGSGFNIMHDGGHKAYSRHPVVNKFMALTLDMLGASSYFWDFKHNQQHHTYSNIAGHDDDIEMGILGRLSPHHKHLFFHRWQHFYLWFLYGFISSKWHLIDDFVTYFRAKIGDRSIPRPKGWDLATFIGGKLLFFTLVFAIPLIYHPWYLIVPFYLGVSFIQGVVISVVFQLAHCVEEAEFPLPDDATDRIENAFFMHQIETTIDFARDSDFLTWYLGGLNFQVEHHLFPRICHVHYPALAKIVEQTSKEFGVQYHAHKTFRDSLVSHYRLLKEMGQPTPA